MSSRGPKRNKVTETEPNPSSIGDKHDLFTAWSRDCGVECNGVRPAKLPGRGIGLVTTKRLKEGERLLFIPEKAMFKPDSSTLKQEDLDRASPQAQLAVSAMLEFNNAGSPSRLWETVWPTWKDFEESMPMCWPTALQRELPSSVHQPLERQLADYRKDWNASRELCGKSGRSEEDFRYYWMIVNSRSFHWKPPRGKGGLMVMCPFIDYINHGPTGSSCRVTQNAKGYEVTADRKYEPGEEILATYGAHSNDKLLVHYGFMCAKTSSGPSADDEIRLDHLIIPKLDAEVKPQLQDVGFLGSYSLIPSTGELCFKTQVAIRATMLTANEWEYFILNGEDLSVDYTPTVNTYVKQLLTDYRSEAEQKLQLLAEQAQTTAQGLLILRWSQIIDAIDTFEAFSTFSDS